MRDGAAHPFSVIDARLLRRHALVSIARDHHAALSDTVEDGSLRRAVTQWLARGTPLVVRRQNSDVAIETMPTTIAVGMPLSPVEGRHRLAFTLPAHAIAALAPPIALADAAARLASSWRAPLTRLADAATAIDVTLRVFGSVAWEALTGATYVARDSDVDVLWRPVDTAQLRAGIALLHRWERETGISADGEILFGDDAAVAWREWDRVAQANDPASRVLVKTLRGSHLVAPEALLARLGADASAVANMACA